MKVNYLTEKGLVEVHCPKHGKTFLVCLGFAKMLLSCGCVWRQVSLGESTGNKADHYLTDEK